MKTAARFPPPTPKKLPYQFIIKTILSYYVIDVTSQCAHLHIILNIQCVQNLFQWHSNMCSFASLYPVINIFLVWSSISWSAELKAVVEPQGDCFVCQLQVSRLAHFIIYWPETTSSVIIGYQPKNGTNSLHHGCSLVLLLLLLSPWYSASSPFIKLPLEPCQTHPKWPRTAPGRVHLAHPRNCRCSHWLQPWPHPLLPLNGHLPADSHTQGVCIRMIALGPGIGLREGAALFCGQKHSTVALWPSSGNNDTAEPIDISRDVDTAAATSPQWHSMALLSGHDVLARGFFPGELGHVPQVLCECTSVFHCKFHNEGTSRSG